MSDDGRVDLDDIEPLSAADAQAMREIAETMIQAYCRRLPLVLVSG